jgi:hypothetical protein
MTFLEDPIAVGLLALAAIFLVVSLIRHFRDGAKPNSMEQKTA